VVKPQLYKKLVEICAPLERNRLWAVKPPKYNASVRQDRIRG
jgi:hypothetical protein